MTSSSVTAINLTEDLDDEVYGIIGLYNLQASDSNICIRGWSIGLSSGVVTIRVHVYNFSSSSITSTITAGYHYVERNFDVIS